MISPAISMSDVSFYYGETCILKDVNLEIEDGAFMYIVGPNGGGKTTLLRLMLGLMRPDTGRITVMGQNPGLRQRQIGYVPQHIQYDPQFPINVLDIVLMGRIDRSVTGRYSALDYSIARRSLHLMEMDDAVGQPFSELSGGQRQRVLIARALACEPRVLLLDEPTASLDAQFESRLMEILCGFKGDMTILVVSHDLEYVASAVNEVICVNQTVQIHPTEILTAPSGLHGQSYAYRRIRHDRRVVNSGASADE